jgi:hypothetical protein
MLRVVAVCVALLGVWSIRSSDKGTGERRMSGKDPLEGLVKCPDLPEGRDDVELTKSVLAYCRGGMESVYLEWEIRLGKPSALFVPNERVWRERKPDWAKDRRDEIVARVVAIMKARGWQFQVIESKAGIGP